MAEARLFDLAKVTDRSHMQLWIKVYKAKNLANADAGLYAGNLTDAYVRLQIGKGDVGRTKAIQNNLNPTWNELIGPVPMLGDAPSGTLLAHLWDEDVGKDDRMGAAEFDLAQVASDKPTELQGKAKDDAGKVVGTVFLMAQYLPRVGPPVDPGAIDPESDADAAARLKKGRGVLSIKVSRAEKLRLPRGLVSNSKLDPFCEVWIEGEKKPRKRSSVKRQTDAPVFDEDYYLALSEPTGAVVILKFFDENPPLLPTLLGEIRVPLSAANIAGAPEQGRRALEGGTSHGESFAEFSVSYAPKKDEGPPEEAPRPKTARQPTPEKAEEAKPTSKSMKAPKGKSILDGYTPEPRVETPQPAAVAPPPPPKQAAGRLHVRVAAAEGLPKVERFGTIDPYVVAELAGVFKAEPSATARGTDPVWDYAPPPFEVMEIAGATLRLAVWDQESTAANRGVAEVRLAVADYADGSIRNGVEVALGAFVAAPGEKGLALSVPSYGRLILDLHFVPTGSSVKPWAGGRPKTAAAAAAAASAVPWACYPAKRAPGPPPTYVVIGKSDDLAFAKAELLARLAEASLPCVTIQVDMFHPSAWRHQLRTTCSQLGFGAHDRSPLCYDGSCRYIGGLEEFATMMLHKYGLVDDTPPDDVRAAAEENAEMAESELRRERVDRYLAEREARVEELAEGIEGLEGRHAALGKLQAALEAAGGALDRLRAMAAAESSADPAASFASLATALQEARESGEEEEDGAPRSLSDELAAEAEAILAPLAVPEAPAGEGALDGAAATARAALAALGPLAAAARRHHAHEAAQREARRAAAEAAEAQGAAAAAEGEPPAAAAAEGEAPAEGAPASAAAPAEHAAPPAAAEGEAAPAAAAEKPPAEGEAAAAAEEAPAAVDLVEFLAQAASAQAAATAARAAAAASLAQCAASLEGSRGALQRAKDMQETDLAEEWLLAAARERARGPPPSPRPLGMD